ncbi:glycosyltransferase family 4 protein [Streptomyces sp. NPDC050085]|uniref:glycosyltransferase family 4 protein n=1 Tax=Streptomyces sp. NPDC050085 TaxID=3365600 RepID=UPI003792F3DB
MAEGGEVRASRGRVVMLVCNGVKGDSRVQKAARSAAEAGWDVVLLGRSPDSKQHTWRLGEAEVRLIPVPLTLGAGPYRYRRPWLRRPLAYRPGPTAAYQAQRVKARRADLHVRRCASRIEARRAGWRGLRGRLAQLLLIPARSAAKARAGWVGLRGRHTTRWQESRRTCDLPLDRLRVAVWRALLGRRSWRRLWPMLWDFELGYGKVVDRLRPDLIHANDFRVLGVGARATLRARSQGRPAKLVWDAHEFLPGIKPWALDARWKPAHIDHEREYAPYADAVVTVSGTLADLLRDTHRLPRTPAVVLNAPEAAPAPAQEGDPVPCIRETCGVRPDVPLLVYSGGAVPQRGLVTMVEGMPQLPDAHVALVVHDTKLAYVRELRARAAELGASERLHVLPYVPYWQVSRFLASADVGVIPIHHYPNHELALITKFFEYSHARLPIVVSDVRTMARTVRETGQGEVFTAEDVTAYVDAVRKVLAAPARYRAAYDAPGLLESWTWEAQAGVLDEVYSELLPDRPRFPQRTTSSPEPAPTLIGGN